MRLNRRTYHIFISLAALILALSSCGSAKKLISKGDSHYDRGQYAAAGDFYRKAYAKISYKDKELRAETAFKQGDCYQKINFSRAEQVFMNAVRNNYPDSTVFLRLAQAQQRNGKLAPARESYETYLEAFPGDELGVIGLAGVELADSLLKNPSRYKIAKERMFVSGRSSSLSPAFVDGDADLLIYTTNRKVSSKEKALKPNPVVGQPNFSLFQIRKNSQGVWEKPEIVEGEINTKNDEGVASFTANGQQMYFTRSITEDPKGDGTEIVVSSRSGGAWGAPSTITLYNDSSISVAHPAISPDGSTLYFVSDAPGGFGGKDIWRTKLEGGKPTFIENLGPEINTAGDEMFPTFKPDGTLYFSSNGHPGLGGLDIFEAVEITEEDGSKGWQVLNLGTPVNSHADDFGMTFAGETNTGFFSSNRDHIRGYDAIYSFDLPDLEYFLEGKILSRRGTSVPEARINIVGSDGETARISAKGDGSYRFKLKPEVSYLLQASGKEYLNQSDTISTFNLNPRASETYTRNFNLAPTFESTRIENIYYDFDKASLRPESKEGLDELIEMMEENPHITIELSSHTDYKGSNIYNRDLSARRAQSVVDYLIEAGVDGARLTAIGYGEEKPTVINEIQAQEHDFLPLGTVLTEEFILTLSEEQQEIANQINRRTEFKVTATNFGLF